MATNIQVIASGYANAFTTTQHLQPCNSLKFMSATGSCCLVRSGGKIILFDTMGPWEKDILQSKLAELKLHTDDVNLLVCSHSHPDHVGNLNLFAKAEKHFVGTSVYSKDIYDLNCFEPVGNYNFTTPKSTQVNVIRYQPYIIDSNLTIEVTHGHTMECISLLVKNCEDFGSVGLVGDLFECEADLSDEGIWLGAGSQNPDLQRANRSLLLQSVNYILPGHGSLFKVPTL